MANVTIEQLLEAQKTIVETVDNTGAILTSERYLTVDDYVGLFSSINHDKSNRGIMILFQEIISQTKGPRQATIQQKLRFSYEIIEPVEQNPVDGIVSNAKFLLKLQAINAALNLVVAPAQPWNLGITTVGANVEHQFLQGDGPIHVKPVVSGSVSSKIHYCSMSLDVLVVISAYG